jgi:hypothetical protein
MMVRGKASRIALLATLEHISRGVLRLAAGRRTQAEVRPVPYCSLYVSLIWPSQTGTGSTSIVGHGSCRGLVPTE